MSDFKNRCINCQHYLPTTFDCLSQKVVLFLDDETLADVPEEGLAAFAITNSDDKDASVIFSPSFGCINHIPQTGTIHGEYKIEGFSIHWTIDYNSNEPEFWAMIEDKKTGDFLLRGWWRTNDPHELMRLAKNVLKDKGVINEQD